MINVHVIRLVVMKGSQEVIKLLASSQILFGYETVSSGLRSTHEGPSAQEAVILHPYSRK